MNRAAIRTLALPLLLVVAGCGGSGTPRSGPGPDPAPAPSPAEIARSMLEGCGRSGLQELLLTLDLVESALALDPAEGSITLDGLDPFAATAAFTLRVGGETVAIGLRFLDASGNATNPFGFTAMLAFLAGALSFEDLLALAPDGTRMVVGFQRVNAPFATIGSLEVELAAGLPVASSGWARASAANCQTTVAWEDLPVADLESVLPGLAFELVVRTFQPDHTLAGTVSLDGSGGALLVVTLDGGPTFGFALDLTTGVLTAIP
jgi:hypothetical protein